MTNVERRTYFYLFLLTSSRKAAHVLKFVTCLRIPLFLNNEFIVYYLRMEGLGSHKIVHFFVGVIMLWTQIGCFSMSVFLDRSLLETARFSSAIFSLIRLNWKWNYCHYVINDIWWNEGSPVKSNCSWGGFGVGCLWLEEKKMY